MTALISVVSRLRRGAAGLTLAGVLVGGGLLGGCQNQDQDTIRALNDRNTALTKDKQALQEQVRLQEGAIQARDQTIAEQRNLIAQLRSQNLQSAELMAQWDERLRGMSFSQIDPAMDAELRSFAERNPQLVTYDSERGMLRFKSDLTFDSGSDVVRASAKSTLASLANVLNQDAAQKYDIRIVGHTDNQPISSGTASRHPTNMHLSCHRAIGVRKELVSLGVTPDRVEAAGRGQFDPLVPNNPSGGTAANRRVEIFLVRSMRSDTAPTFADVPTEEQQPEIMK